MQSKQVESGVQLFSRLSQKNLLDGINTKLFKDGGPYSNQVIDVVFEKGAESADLIIDFIVRCILPNEYNSEWKSSGAVLLNTTFQINVMIIIKVMNALLKKHKVPNVKSVIETSLKNLTVLNCYEFEQTKLTYYNLEHILHQKDNVALLVVDNITSHYWEDKTMMQMTSLLHHTKKMFELLHSIVNNLNITVVFCRNEKEISNKTISSKIDYKIIVEKISDEEFRASVLDFHKQSEISTYFLVDIALEFT